MATWTTIASGAAAREKTLEPGKTYRLYFTDLLVFIHEPDDVIRAVKEEYLLGRQVKILKAWEHYYSVDGTRWTLAVEVEVLSGGGGQALGKQSAVFLTVAMVIAAIAAMSVLLMFVEKNLTRIDEMSVIGVKAGDKTYGLKVGGVLSMGAIAAVLYGLYKLA